MARGRYRAGFRSISAAEIQLEELDKAIARMKEQQQAPPATAMPPSTVAPTGPTLHLNVALLLTAEPFLSVQLRADSRTGKHLAGELTDRASLVARGAANDLIRALIKAGHTPKVNE